MQIVVGIDIGGTKSAISFAGYHERDIRILKKIKKPTITENYQQAFEEYIEIIRNTFREEPDWQLCSIGISCGGPLDLKNGVILAPPNLPRWDKADIFTPLRKAFKVPVMIQNDADACALAEWSMGAGKGTQNMIFLTFGTGMGAGLILNSELYSGAGGMAGEVGHVRLEKDGPYGYGKNGSFEGFCSGGGIANLGKQKAREALKAGKIPAFCQSMDEIDQISCQKIGRALKEGDETAREIFDIVAEHLGMGLAVLIDILNPELIVIGSIYVRQEDILKQGMLAAVRREALAASVRNCRIVPASLGEMLGDYAAISVGIKAYKDFYRPQPADRSQDEK